MFGLRPGRVVSYTWLPGIKRRRARNENRAQKKSPMRNTGPLRIRGPSVVSRQTVDRVNTKALASGRPQWTIISLFGPVQVKHDRRLHLETAKGRQVRWNNFSIRRFPNSRFERNSKQTVRNNGNGKRFRANLVFKERTWFSPTSEHPRRQKGPVAVKRVEPEIR